VLPCEMLRSNPREFVGRICELGMVSAIAGGAVDALASEQMNRAPSATHSVVKRWVNPFVLAGHHNLASTLRVPLLSHAFVDRVLGRGTGLVVPAALGRRVTRVWIV